MRIQDNTGPISSISLHSEQHGPPPTATEWGEQTNSLGLSVSGSRYTFLSLTLHPILSCHGVIGQSHGPPLTWAFGDALEWGGLRRLGLGWIPKEGQDLAFL